MAAVIDRKNDPAAKFESQVDEQIAQATSRIRAHDLALGGLSLVALGLVYATAMILLDRYLGLPEWVRQLALVGFLAASGAIAYFLIVRPLRRSINPLYAAVQVEKTIDDAKNSVAGYVDAKENAGVHPTVRAAMGAKAAKTVVKADLNRAVDHRSLVWAGGVGVLFLLVLVVLFFVFGFNQFSSVLRRTFVPFSSDAIATRTQLRVTKPEPPNATVTAGQTVVIGVEVGGRIPDPNDADRVRVLIRHNPNDPTYIPVPMEPGESKRDWQVKLQDYHVQNGFWYKVAAGDAETPEYRVTVHSLPLVESVEVGYRYPAYLNAKPGVRKDPRIEAPRGTLVTITARSSKLKSPEGEARREVKDARLVIDFPADPETGAPAESVTVPWSKVDGEPDAMRFTFRVTRRATYRILFTTTTGDKNPDPQPDEIHVTPDDKPQPVIVKPAENPVAVAANGQLAVDGTVTDDHGIDTVTLKMRVAGPNPVPLADRPFLNAGNPSFRRTEPDGRVTWPDRLDYADSVDLGSLTDADGKPVKLTEGMELEYWLEATDNRHDATDRGTKPAPQLGTSAVRKVMVGPPTMTPAEQKKQDQLKQERKAEEKQRTEQQQQQLNNEKREPKPQPGDQGKQGEPQPQPENQPKKNDAEATPKSGGMDQPPMAPMPQANPTTEPMPMSKTDPAAKTDMPPPKTPESKADPMNPGTPNPSTAPMPKAGPSESGKTEPQPMPGGTPPPGQEPKPDHKKADDFNQAIKDFQKNATEGGSSKPEPPKGDPMSPPDSKPKPKPEDKTDEQPKPEPQPMDPANPMGGTGGASETKPEQKPQGGSEGPKQEAKPTPKGADPADPKAEPPASDAKPEPTAGAQAADRPSPQPKKEMGDGPMPKTEPNAQAKQDPGAGGEAKPEKNPKPESGSSATPMPKSEPTAGQQPQQGDPSSQTGMAKPRPENDKGTDKPTPAEPKAGEPTESAAKTNSGEAKPEKAEPTGKPEPTGQSKAMPKDDPMAGGKAEAKPEPKAGATAETKPAGPKDDTSTGAGQPKPQDAGRDKSVNPKDNMASGSTPDKKEPGAPTGGADEQKIDPKEVVNDAKDLNNPDPARQKAAQDKLDKTAGPENRKEIEKSAKDLTSKDMNARAAAEKKIEDVAKKAAAEQEKKEPGGQAAQPRLDPKDLEKAIKDANSATPEDRKRAEEQLAKLGPEDRKRAEEIAKGLNSKDPKEQADAQKRLDDLKRDAEGQAKKEPDPKQPKLDPKDVDDLKNKAGDLTSPDKQKREAAEKAFDDKLGKAEREKLQKELEDAPGAPEAKEQLARDKIDELAKGRGGTRPPGNADPTAPPGSESERVDLEAAKEDARNRLKSAELQLDQFEKNRYNKAIQEAKGWSQKEVDDLIDGKRSEVEALKAQLADLEQGRRPAGPATNNASEARKLDLTKGPEGPAGRGGAEKAPPGYNDAQKRFNQGVLKTKQ